MGCPNIQVLTSDLRVNGALVPDTLDLPAGSVTDRVFVPYARIPKENTIHQLAVSYSQQHGTSVVAETRTVHTFRKAATILAVSVMPIAKPIGAKSYSVNVKKGNSGSGYASVLSAAVVVDSSSANRTAQAGTLAVPDTPCADGDSLQIEITTTGASGTQGQGVNVIVWIREEG